MKRQWHTARIPDADGSDRSVQLAHALAQVLDPPTLEALLQSFTLLDRIGGQVYIASVRTKYKTVVDADAQTVERVPVEDVREPGSYETDGFVFHYEHIAKLPRAEDEGDDRQRDSFPDLPVEASANGGAPEEPVADTAESVQADRE
jgi:hypothetical protein